MKNFWWKTIGTGKYHLVLLHGWGLNSDIWCYIQEKLIPKCTLHLVDLPGFGRNQTYGALELNKMTECILEEGKYGPQKAIWLGWSLGGIVASKISLTQPERVQALITVASSPCFVEKKKWPGIKPKLLSDFQQHLQKDCRRTIKRFLTLQTIGARSVKQDINILKEIVFASSISSIEVLHNALEILKTTDLREELIKLQVPHLRFYGYFDLLVPYKIVQLLDVMWPQSKSITIMEASHIPFISSPTKFCFALLSIINSIF